MFYGTVPGTGKTALSTILVNSIDCDVLTLNASDENNVETIRTKVVNFCTTMGDSPLKVVLLREADGLSQAAQFALKDVIEEYSDHTRFVFTLNNIGKMISPIISRCELFEMKKLPKELIISTVETILRSENITFKREDIVSIVKKFYPDFRTIIKIIQFDSINGTLVYDSNTPIDIIAYILIMLQDKASYKQIFEYVKTNDIVDYLEIMQILFDEVDTFIKPDLCVGAMMEIAEHIYRDGYTIDKQTNFLLLILKLTTLK